MVYHAAIRTKLICRTLIDSTPGVLSAWATFAGDYGFNADEAAHASHGRRLYDTLKEYCGISDDTTLHVITVSSDHEGEHLNSAPRKK